MFFMCAVLLLIFVYIYLIKLYRYWEEKNVKHSKPSFIFGNLASNVFRKKCFVDMLNEKYMEFSSDRYFGFYEFLSPIFVIKDINLIKQITVKDFEYFPEHKSFTNEDVDPLWGRNLFASKVKRWREIRPKLSPTFTSSKMKTMFHLLTESAEQFTVYFSSDSEDVICVDIKDAFTRYANDVIATTAFGFKCDSLKHRTNEFYLMGIDATDFSGLRGLKFLLNEKVSKFLKVKMFSKKVRTFFKNIISETVRDREEKGIIRNDMIHLLMEARKGKLKQDEEKTIDTGFATALELNAETGAKEGKGEISIDDITAQALIFLFAGFDTTATLMSYIAYELALHPDIQEKLHEEVESTFEEGNGKLTFEGLMSMKYMDMIVSESLRKWPAGFIIDRKLVKPYTIQPENANEKPVHLEAGTIIWIPVYSIHRDPKYFPNPEKFDPERFADDNLHNIQQCSYIPFGSGPRSCIGSRFALMENKIIIFYMLRKFEIVVVDDTPIPLVMDPSYSNLTPIGGLWVGLRQRSDYVK